MVVRKTEQRIPVGFAVDDLGQAVTSTDGKAALVSFNSTPIVHQQLQGYVVFVLDDTLVTQVEQYNWSIQNEEVLDTSVTKFG